MTEPCTNGAQTGARVHCIGQRCLLLAAACVIGGADALLTSPRRGPRRGAALGAKTTQTIYITDGVGDPFPIKPHKLRRAASGKKGFAAAPAAAPDGAFGKLCRWVAKKGGKSDGVAVGDVGGGLRGVVATRDFAVSDTVFSVPKAECVLSEGRDRERAINATCEARLTRRHGDLCVEYTETFLDRGAPAAQGRTLRVETRGCWFLHPEDPVRSVVLLYSTRRPSTEPIATGAAAERFFSGVRLAAPR